MVCSSARSKMLEASTGSPDELSVTNSANSASMFLSCLLISVMVEPKLSEFSSIEFCNSSYKSSACLTRALFFSSCSFKVESASRIDLMSSSTRSNWLSILLISPLALKKWKVSFIFSASKIWFSISANEFVEISIHFWFHSRKVVWLCPIKWSFLTSSISSLTGKSNNFCLRSSSSAIRESFRFLIRIPTK